MTGPDACYFCEKTEGELNAAGHQLYFCESSHCDNQCCSEHSESGPEPDTGHDRVLCLRCYDAANLEPE